MESLKPSYTYSRGIEDHHILLVKIKSGDAHAFKDFFFLMQPAIFRFLYHHLSDKDSAEDLTQETFVKFWLNRDKINPEFPWKSYLFKIARNLAINYISRKPQTTSYNDNQNLLANLAASETDFTSIFLMDDYQSAINTLPERCKTTFLLSRFFDFEYSEIAQIMNVSLQTVKNQMNKALAVLRCRLVKYID